MADTQFDIIQNLTESVKKLTLLLSSERERCAKIAEQWNEGYSITAKDIAAAIRSGK